MVITIFTNMFGNNKQYYKKCINRVLLKKSKKRWKTSHSMNYEYIELLLNMKGKYIISKWFCQYRNLKKK